MTKLKTDLDASIQGAPKIVVDDEADLEGVSGQRPRAEDQIPAPLEPNVIANLENRPLEQQVTAAPVWRYDANAGLVAPDGYRGKPPGCIIAEGKDFPKQLEHGGAIYDHLRNGFYIGQHATDREIAGLFDTLAPTYEREEINVGFNLKVYRDLAKFAEGALPKRDVKSILDFGCGSGVGARILEKRVEDAEIFGFDLSPEMRKLAAENGMTAVEEQGGKLALADESIDMVVSAFVLHLVRSPEWINELARVLKPGGTAAFNIYKPPKVWKKHFSKWFEDAGLVVVVAKKHHFFGGGIRVSMPLLVVRKPNAGA